MTAKARQQSLADEERQAWVALASLMTRLPAALDAQLRRDAGLSHFAYQVLRVLADSPRRTRRMSEIAWLADGSLSRLSQVVARLERHGWVLRTTDPRDGRYTLATLTEAGLATVTAATPAHLATVRALVFDPLTGRQVQQLREIGRRICRAVDPDSACLNTGTPPAC